MDQAEEHGQMVIEALIRSGLQIAYDALLKSDRPEAEEHLGHIAEIKAFWEGDGGSVG